MTAEKARALGVCTWPCLYLCQQDVQAGPAVQRAGGTNHHTTEGVSKQPGVKSVMPEVLISAEVLRPDCLQGEALSKGAFAL